MEYENCLLLEHHSHWEDNSCLQSIGPLKRQWLIALVVHYNSNIDDIKIVLQMVCKSGMHDF